MNDPQQQQPQQNQQQNQQQQQQQKMQMNFAPQPAAAFPASTNSGNPVLSQEQFEALKRHHAQAQAAARNSNSVNAPAPAATNTQSAGGNSNASNAGMPQQQGPYMVLTQVAVPAQFNPNQLQQLLLQQQQCGAPTAGSQPQILSFNQLPPQVQQQILAQQQQQQIQGQQSQSSNPVGQQPQQQQQAQVWQQQLQQQPIQQQAQQPQAQQQQQPASGAQGTLTMSDIQDLLKNNQLDANLVQQLLAKQIHKPNNNTSNTATATNDSTLSDMLNSFNAATSAADKDSSSDITNNSGNKMFLEAQVQPVQRQNQNDTYNDDDLFKFFDVENLLGDDSAGNGGEDLLSPSAAPSVKKPNEMPQSNNQFQNFSSYMEPTPMFQQGAPALPQQAQSQAMHQASAPAQVSSSVALQGMPAAVSNGQQQQQIQAQQQQQQQLQRQQQPQHVPLAVPSQPQGARPAAVPSQANGPPNQTFSLPSTMVPPTVLASVCTGKAGKRSATRKKAPASKRAKRMDTPQDVLMKLVEQQGHPDMQRIKSEDAGYDTMPSPLQLSSFGTQVVHAVHTNDSEMLGKLLSCGLSPNPCNQFRDSILDLVCKRNNVAIFNCLLEHGSDLRVVDGFGRTPLHHCAWASSFSREIAEAIVERDPIQLFVEDKRGQTPMEYVRVETMSTWSEFLEEMAEKFWPKGAPAPKLNRPKDSRPDGTLPDPKNAVSAGLASMISSGNISVDQFQKMDEATRKTYG